MQEIFTGVSWAGVFTGAIVAFLFGWLWYSDRMFGAKWREGSGIEGDGNGDMRYGPMVTILIGLFLMSWFVGVTAVGSALLTVILATLAFTVLAYAGGMFAQRSAYARNVDAGFWILSLVIMIVAQAIF